MAFFEHRDVVRAAHDFEPLNDRLVKDLAACECICELAHRHAGLDRGADKPRVGTIQDAILARHHGGFETAGLILGDALIDRAHRGEFVSADTYRARESRHVLLRLPDERGLRAHADVHLSAQGEAEQQHHQRYQFGFEV